MAIIDRAAAEALIQEQIIGTIQQDTPKASVFMQLARKLPNMTSKQTRIPVLDMLPTAYWVNGDTGFKETSEQGWDNVYLTAAELAVIVPIPEAVLDDASFDIMGEIKPRVIEAIGKRVDEAVIFGINRPAEWETDIVTRARQAGNVISGDEVNYDNLLGEGGVIAKIEEGGFMANGGIAAMGMRAKLRGIKSEAGDLLFKSDMQGATQYALDGIPLYFPVNGSFDKNKAQLIVGDWSQAVYAIRQDVTVKLLDQGVIQNPVTKEIVYNLAQQDMVALRVVFRMGWALPTYATRMNENRVYVPFAVLPPAIPDPYYTATVTVTDEDGAVKDAKVNMSGAIRTTDASGKAVFTLHKGEYSYTVKKNGYKSVKGEISVDGITGVSEDVELVKN